jgi:ATP-dependent Clp protease ATP-binding subunit ClpA
MLWQAVAVRYIPRFGSEMLANLLLPLRHKPSVPAENKEARRPQEAARVTGGTKMAHPTKITLDPSIKSPLVEVFENGLRARIIGQDRAVRTLASLYQVFQSGLMAECRPLGTMLFLGPTGSGKTRIVEAAAELLFGDASAVVKIDCAEFQHSHEISKLIGSPPGYLGHRETPPLLTQESLARYHSERNPFTLVLFDEVEKASDALWQLLLGILDKATLTLGDNRRVNFRQTMIFMTSNLGTKEMSDLINGSIGFAPARGRSLVADQVDKKIYHTALDAARRKFSPEFMNRIDKVVVFRSLRHEELTKILDLELKMVQRRVDGNRRCRFSFNLTPQAKAFLLAEGTDYQYGARHLKRAIERHLVYPLSSLLATGQVRMGDLVTIDLDHRKTELIFSREAGAGAAAAGTGDLAPKAAAAGRGRIAA